jgi:4-hydroxy-2-oxoheptanedioate aldolase
MRKSIVRTKLAANQPVLATCLHLTDASIHELVGLMGFDALWFDMEHHGYSVETVTQLLRATRVGKIDGMTRPAKGEYMRMGRMLEAGAAGILYPRCSGAEEAREVVRWAKFAPMGERGFDGGNPDMPYCTMDMAEYVKFANDNTWIACQLEDPQAVDQAEAIAAVPGVDILFFGPGDFSVLTGNPGQINHPRAQAAIEKIAKAAKNQGKNWGMPAGTPERTKELLGLGAKFIAHGADIIHIKLGLEKIQKDFGALGFTFDNQLTAGVSYTQKA